MDTGCEAERSSAAGGHVRNAFGTADRHKMLAEIQAHCPSLFPYAAACYRNANILLGDGYTLESSNESK